MSAGDQRALRENIHDLKRRAITRMTGNFSSRIGSWLRVAVAATAVVAMSACGTTMKPEDFADTEPRLRLETFFAGKVQAWGIFEDRFGKVRRQFVVHVDGVWDGRQLVLDEHFVYSDGEKDRRVWTIAKIDDHTYIGTAADVIGTARGRSYGNTLNWSYDMNLRVGDETWKVRFDDWMFLQPGGLLLNRAVVRRWGIEIGTITLAFMRADARPATAADSVSPAVAE